VEVFVFYLRLTLRVPLAVDALKEIEAGVQMPHTEV
jgi:hypothetical protein